MAEEQSEKKQKQPKNPAEASQKGGGPPNKGGEKKQKAKKPTAADVAADEGAGDEPQQPAPPPRLAGQYKDRVVPALQQKFGYKNRLAVPRLEKIVISMGLGRFATAGGEGKAKFEQAEKELTVIAGQRPVRCKAKKSVANFKVREGMETGLKVTLRGARMWEFLDRLIALATPRVKDFRGLSPDGFDKNGNYNFGFNEQTVFPEVDAAAVTFQQGMNITLVTTARKPEEGRELLRQFGFPFRTEETDKR
jgi:large subunit ribosomal protein L5